ncbi:hypothetical protein BKA93DRAFT_755996 [Sparassis latifolia]|uniref:Uncharacterized protein n=1 Tax=Sparassis crispa TaxID=139825 RepID=A0A401GGB4_9APHY|nr:predicted protein [Sparassis crispa]GBE81165.1 predicted protein [Sparassis crispa]
MSFSNTATTTYHLVKYSRSYPQPSGAVGPEEWQHFVNPILRLALDVKKSPGGDLESFRLRVLWSLDSQTDSANADQREVVFEDLELLSFSSLPSSISQGSTAQGLPLKAVYRDAVVGVRYLHPRAYPLGTTPTYRRFQITFQSAASAAAFIDSIRFICPCKLTPAPAPAVRNATKATTMTQPGSVSSIPAMTQVQIFSQVNASTPSRRVDTPLRSSATISSPWTMQDDLSKPFHHPQNSLNQHATSLEQNRAQSHLAEAPPQSAALAHQRSSIIPFVSDMHPPSRPSSAITDCSGLPTDPGADSQARPLERLGAYYTSSLPRHGSPNSLVSSDPPSSAVTTTRNMAPPAAPSPILVTLPSVHAPSLDPSHPAPLSADSEKQAFLTSLNEIPTLYNLPRRDLENLVAKVIREEGFAKLLEDLDSMWRVKGFVGRSAL